jgi:hypothetical protein
MKGREKIFEVRRIYNDVNFIDEFLTEEFVEKHKMYQHKRDPQTGEVKVVSRDFQRVKQTLLHHLTNMGQPFIYVVDANYLNRGELYLAHKFAGLEVDAARRPRCSTTNHCAGLTTSPNASSGAAPCTCRPASTNEPGSAGACEHGHFEGLFGPAACGMLLTGYGCAGSMGMRQRFHIGVRRAMQRACTAAVVGLCACLAHGQELISPVISGNSAPFSVLDIHWISESASLDDERKEMCADVLEGARISMLAAQREMETRVVVERCVADRDRSGQEPEGILAGMAGGLPEVPCPPRKD